jgi:hypothetical protein
MLRIGSLYAHGYSSEELDRIQRLGFSLRPAPSAYAGAQSLRFIDFADGPALELIHVLDQRAYADFVPPGMAPHCPGISVVVDSGPSAMLDDYQAAHRAWKPYCLHVDNEGGSDAATPGTDYLNFEKPLVEKTFIYLTEFQNPAPERPSPPTHPNAATHVSGLVFDLPGQALAPLFNLFGQNPSDGTPALGDLSIHTEVHVPDEIRKRNKPFPLVAVVVATRADEARPGQEVSAIRWLGKQARLAEMNPLSWDLILTT